MSGRPRRFSPTASKRWCRLRHPSEGTTKLRLTDAGIVWPRQTLLIAAAIAGLATPGLWRLELDADGRALAPQQAPEVHIDREVSERFGIGDPVVVLLRADGPEGVLQPAILDRIRALTDVLKALPGVRSADVTSLATEYTFRHQPGSLRYRTLLDPLPGTPDEIGQLRSDLDRIGIYDGTLISADRSAATILVGVPRAADRGAFVESIRREADSSGITDQLALDVIGAPVAETRLARHILADLGLPGEPADERRPTWHPGMVAIAVAVMALVFLIAFRRPAAALLPLAEIGLCLAVVFGAMGWLGVPIYLSTTVLPVILVAVGAADEIHIFRRYLELRSDPDQGPEHHLGVVRMTLTEIAPPVVRTSITTAVAFLSFALSPIEPVRWFGLFAAGGVLICMLASLTVVPAVLVLAGPGPWVRRGAAGAPPFRSAAALASLGGFVFRRHRWLLGAMLVSIVLAADGVRRIGVQDSWIGGFAADSRLARTTRWFDQHFLGSHLLRLQVEVVAPRLEGVVDEADLGPFGVLLDPAPAVEPGYLEGSWIRFFELPADERASATPEPRQWSTWIERAERGDGTLHLRLPPIGGSPRAWLRPATGARIGWEIRSQPLMVPATLKRIARLERFLADQRGVGGVLGPARYLKTIGFMMRPESASSRRLPTGPKEVRNLWHNYGVMRGEERLRQLIDREYRRALVTVYLEGSDYRKSRVLMAGIRQFERENLNEHGIRLGLAGDVAVSQALVRGVVTTQIRSVALSLLTIVAVVTVSGGSLLRGLWCVIPSAFAVLVGFAVMGWAGIPLGVATSMFAAMTLGVGVDFAIHLFARRDLARCRGLGEREAISAALAGAGAAIVIDALAVGLGFGVLVSSTVPANARLGALLAICVLVCLAATLLLLPALVACAVGKSWCKTAVIDSYRRSPKYPRARGRTRSSTPARD